MKENTGSGPRAPKLMSMNNIREGQMSRNENRENFSSIDKDREGLGQEEPSKYTASGDCVNG